MEELDSWFGVVVGIFYGGGSEDYEEGVDEGLDCEEAADTEEVVL